MAEWRVYGCGSASSNQFLQSSYEFAEGEDRLHIDFGNGALYQRCRSEGDIFSALDSIEHLFITHSHADHTVDLTRHVVAWKYSPGYSPGKPVHLYGDRTTLDNVRKLIECATFPGLFDEIFVLHPVEANKPFTIGQIAVRPFHVHHMPGALGVHLHASSGVSAAFTGDTSPFDELADEIQQADLLIAEASFFDMDHPMHLTVGQAAEIAEKTRANTLMMVHAYPDVETLESDAFHERVGKFFSGACHAAYDGLALSCDKSGGEWVPRSMF